MEKFNLSAPWITFVHEVTALFEDDPDIRIKFDSQSLTLKLFVEDPYKADAIKELLPEEKMFGEVPLKIEVVPANREVTKADLFNRAFSGNPALQFVFTSDSMFGPVSYIVFTNKVVQFFNDQMDDINGNKSTLFQDIAKDVFGTDHGVFYCTDTKTPDLIKPLGEWP